ncbi:tetratricopeptide repeat protein [Megalodesulfovibrio paquesii]
MPPKRDDASNKMSRRQLFSRLVPPGVKELAEKANPDLQKKRAEEEARAQAQADAQAREMERRVSLARDGNVALAAGDLAEAVRHFRDFAKEYPKEIMPRLCLGRALYDLGQYIQARVEFQRALALAQSSPKEAPAHQLDHATLFLGLCLLRLKKYWKAYELWNAWHPQGVPVLAEALDKALPGIRQLAMDPEEDTAPSAEAPSETAAGANIASALEDAAACPAVADVETAVARTPWAHLPPMVPAPVQT